MDRITEGRIVHYVFANKHGQLVHRPAIVVNAWDGQLTDNKVNLVVFVDGTNDVVGDVGSQIGLNTTTTTVWATSVPYSEEPAINSWHWPIH